MAGLVIRILRERRVQAREDTRNGVQHAPFGFHGLATGLVYKGGPHDLAECLKTSYGLAKYRDVGAPRLAPRVFRGAVAARRGAKRP